MARGGTELDINTLVFEKGHIQNARDSGAAEPWFQPSSAAADSVRLPSISLSLACHPVPLPHAMADDAPGEHRPKRRNAVRQAKQVQVKGHKFVLTYFKSFTFCGHCGRFLW